jgi:AraC-like DNA-binding protein
MSDFASAAMIRILAAGMRMNGLAVPAVSQAGARVPLDAKRQLLANALAQGGWAALPLLGRGIRALRGDPVHQALSSCAEPAQLIARWCRLEGYIHSRHRITYEAPRSGGLQVFHRSLRTQEPPLPHENLVVLGVLAAAIEETGATGVRVRISGTAVYPHGQAASIADLAQAHRTACWHIDWDADGQTAPAPARRLLQDRDAAPAELLRGPPVAQGLGRVLAADLMHPPPLQEAARRLGKSARTLQRQLAVDGLSYSDVLAETRCRVAAWCLVRQHHSLAETGFLCGFSDQSHFTREFSRRVGVPPAKYRNDFGVAAVPSQLAARSEGTGTREARLLKL